MFTHERTRTLEREGIKNWERKEALGERKTFNKHFNKRPSEVRFIFGLAVGERVEGKGSRSCRSLYVGNSWHRSIPRQSQHSANTLLQPGHVQDEKLMQR